MRCLIIIDSFHHCASIAAFMFSRNIVNYSFVHSDEVANWVHENDSSKALVYVQNIDGLDEKLSKLQLLNIDFAIFNLNENLTGLEFTSFGKSSTNNDFIDWLNVTSSKEQCQKDLMIKIGDTYRKVSIEEILFIQSDGKYISIRIADRTYAIRTSLKLFHNTLPANFIRIHASYIVNKSKIDFIDVKDHEVNVGTYCLPYSRQYKTILFNIFDFH